MKKVALFLVVPMIAACSYMPETPDIGKNISSALDITPMLNPYRIDVRQGNMVTQDMVSQLKLGLTKDQVRFILGTPLLSDIFHADRWDYVYRLKSGNGEVQQRRLVVFFEDGKLAGIGGDVVGEPLGSSSAAAQKPAARVIEIKAPDIPAKPEPAEAPAAAQ